MTLGCLSIHGLTRTEERKIVAAGNAQSQSIQVKALRPYYYTNDSPSENSPFNPFCHLSSSPCEVALRVDPCSYHRTGIWLSSLRVSRSYTPEIRLNNKELLAIITYLERAQQRFVYTHHRTSVVEFPTVVRCRE